MMKHTLLIWVLITLMAHLSTLHSQPAGLPIMQHHSKQGFNQSTHPLSPIADQQELAKQLLLSEGQDHHPQSNWLLYSHVSAPSGLSIYKFQHLFDGYPVLGDWAMMIFGANGELLNMQQSMAKVPALYKALGSSAWSYSTSKLINKHQLSQPIKHIWYKSGSLLKPAYLSHKSVTVQHRPEHHAQIYDATDGQLIQSVSLTHKAAYNYTVYADGNGLPADSVYGSTQPHPTGLPDDTQPTVFANQSVLNIEEIAVTVDDPWLPDGATETVGNNVDVFFNSLLLPDGTYDTNFVDGEAYGPEYQPADGDFRAQLGPGSTFDYTYDPSISANDFYQLFSDPVPSNPASTDPQINAKLVQGFYMANVMRDVFYDAGFTETAGNAQHDNYGRGGIDNDRMIIHGNCFSTFVFTPEDGVQPVMCLGRNSSSSTNKDASFDYSIFAHEWSHYMYKRLVQGPALPSGNQGSSLNEGWADLLGLFMTLDEADFSSPTAAGFTSVYTVGGYFNTDYAWMPIYDPTGTPPDAHFYGIRRWPYGASNPLTFRHIEHKIPLPGSVPYFDWKGRSKFNSEYHSAGEIWAASTWDCFRAILANRTDRTFPENQDMLATYIVAGMAATPPDPTYTEARDGLLLAINQTDLTDWQTCRQTFANRGLGSGAIAPDRFSRTHADVIESFANNDLHLSVIAAELADDLVSFDNDGVLDQFETGNLHMTLKNTGFKPIEFSSIELISSPDYLFPTAANEFSNIPVGGEVELLIPIKLMHDRQYDDTDFTVVTSLVSDNGATSGGGDTPLIFSTHYNQSVSTAASEPLDFAATMDLWTEETINQWFYVNPHFERQQLPGDDDWVIQIDEEYGGFEKTYTSPWLTLDAQSPEFNFSFDHTFMLGDIGQSIRIEYSFNDDDWLVMNTQNNTPAEFLGDSPNHPNLSFAAFNIPDFAGNSQFKVRLYIKAFTDFTPTQALWIIDNFSMDGIIEQPFWALASQPSNDIIFTDGFD